MVYYVEVAGSLILSVTDVRDLGSRRELFVDDWLIHRLESLELRLHYPIQREVALTFDRPWEGPGSYDPVITKEGDRYRLWYRGWPKGATWSNASTCYAESAESADGITWERPNLGLFEIDGSRENNVVIQGTSGVAMCVFRDQNPAAAETYKAIGKHTGRYQARQQGIPTENRDGIRGLVSADGIHWSHLDRDPIIPPPPGDRWPFYDTHNVAFWDPNHGHYVAYLRGFIPPGLRAIRRATSPDFREWTYPELIDMGDAPVEQLYKNAATLYFRAPHLYLMFPKRFMIYMIQTRCRRLYPVAQYVLPSGSGIGWQASGRVDLGGSPCARTTTGPRKTARTASRRRPTTASHRCRIPMSRRANCG